MEEALINPPEFSFGVDLWNQIRIIEDYDSHNIQLLEKVHEFMKKKSEIELEYGKAIQKLVKATKDDFYKKDSAAFQKAVQSSSTAQSWIMLLMETENIGSSHSSIGEGMENIRKGLKSHIKTNEKTHKEKFDEVRRCASDFKKDVEAMEKVRERYEKSNKDMQDANQNCKTKESATPKKDIEKYQKELEKLKYDFEKKTNQCMDIMEQYRTCIGETNLKKKVYYNETIPMLLDSIQENDETNRIDFTKSMFLNYADIHNLNLIPQISISIEQMCKTFQTISSKYDSDMFIKLIKNNEGHPMDYEFEEKVETDSISGLKRNILPRLPIRPNSGHSRTNSQNNDNSIEDDIIQKNDKFSKKKALDRIKQLEKDIVELDKKMEGINLLRNAVMGSPTQSNGLQLDEQLKVYVDQKSEATTKKEKLLVYLKGNISLKVSPTSGTTVGTPEQHYHENDIENIKKDGEITRNGEKCDADFFNEEEITINAEITNQIVVDVVQKTCVILKATVVYDYIGTTGTDELTIRTGQILEVLVRQDDGWYQVRLYDESSDSWKNGVIPGNYTSDIEG